MASDASTPALKPAFHELAEVCKSCERAVQEGRQSWARGHIHSQPKPELRGWPVGGNYYLRVGEGGAEDDEAAETNHELMTVFAGLVRTPPSIPAPSTRDDGDLVRPVDDTA